MKYDSIEAEVTVRPLNGMQLTEGYIRKQPTGFQGCIPGFGPEDGTSLEEVRFHMEQKAKSYYGEDVIVKVTTPNNRDD